jgi:ribosomal protein S27AE
MSQMTRIKKRLVESYPNYGVEFLLDLVQSENGQLLGFPQNLERALLKLRNEYELMLCNTCMQMKNHIKSKVGWVCGKCGSVQANAV